MEYIQVRYDSRVVIYDRKMFIWLATGLVVEAEESQSEGCDFESKRPILYGHFFTFICCKNCNGCLKRQI